MTRASPTGPAYAASKAAVRYYGEGLRPRVRRHGVELTVICPGFVDTPLTQVNRFPMPFLMSPEDAARRALAGIERGQARIAYPLPLYWMARLGGMVPPRWLSRLPAKATGGAPPDG